jgi:hypothetical protein
LLGGSSGQLVISGRGLEDERMVVIYAENSIVEVNSSSTEERGINTAQFSTGIEGNHLTTENKPS